MKKRVVIIIYLLLVIIVTSLIYIPRQSVEYWDGGNYGRGFPVQWDYGTYVTNPDPTGQRDLWIDVTDYWALLIDFVLIFIPVVIAGTPLLLIYFCIKKPAPLFGEKNERDEDLNSMR